MYSIGRLAKKFGLSRSALLYYDSIGLLAPSGRGDNGYRRYSEADAARLEQICLHRRAGLSLGDIKRVLDSSTGAIEPVLRRRLAELDGEIEGLREQQRLLVGLLLNEPLLAETSRQGVMNRETWVALLRASGFSDEDMRRWHVAFERHDPARHQAFLEFLGIPGHEIGLIRKLSARARDGENKP